MYDYLILNMILSIAIAYFFAKTKIINSTLCFVLCFSFSAIIGGILVYFSIDKNHPDANKKKKMNSNDIATTVLFLLLAVASGILCHRRATIYEFTFQDFFEDKLCIIMLLLSIGFASLIIYMLEKGRKRIN
ncbi:MAG: hypothetical protein RIS73_2079 [Bacteroidota bacterium]|jgi:magnesium-transporting ATPase (P-type)